MNRRAGTLAAAAEQRHGPDSTTYPLDDLEGANLPHRGLSDLDICDVFLAIID